MENLTVAQVTNRMRVSPGRVRQLISEKRIRIRTEKRLCLIHPDELRHSSRSAREKPDYDPADKANRPAKKKSNASTAEG